MADGTHTSSKAAPVEQRVAAIESLFEERGMEPAQFVKNFTNVVEEQWVPENGARVVARAWTDPAFKRRLLANGRDAVAELGLTMPVHHRHLVVLENTPTVHNVIVLHAVLLHSLLDHRAAPRLVQGLRVPLSRRARVPHGVA